MIDSQSVKTTEVGGTKGFDAGKKVKGRKRHIVVDRLGLLLAVVVHSAGVQDCHGAELVLKDIEKSYPNLKVVWADGGDRPRLPAEEGAIAPVPKILRDFWPFLYSNPAEFDSQKTMLCKYV